MQAIDITDPNPVALLLLCLHLYNHLPNYIAKSTVEFSGALHSNVQRQVSLGVSRCCWVWLGVDECGWVCLHAVCGCVLQGVVGVVECGWVCLHAVCGCVLQGVVGVVECGWVCLYVVCGCVLQGVVGVVECG